MAPLRTISSRKDIWISVAAGVVFGCVFRLVFAFPNIDKTAGEALLLFSLAFLVAAPFAIGYVSVRLFLKRQVEKPTPWYRWLFIPWTCILLTLFVWVAIGWEGTICIVFASPILFASSLLGGVTARIVWGRLAKRSPGIVSAFAFPILFLAVESYFPSPFEIRTVETQIVIHSTPQVVWDQIKSVRAIAPEELPLSWIDRLGFPRPVAATLSHEGIGGVRQASFTGGLVFTEAVNLWDPDRDLRFSIHSDTSAVPRTILDEHATVGGAFFDVLDGEYQIESRQDGVLLHLASHERLSTHLNPYAAFWTDAVMRSIQNEILVVIRNRCEAQNQSALDMFE